MINTKSRWLCLITLCSSVGLAFAADEPSASSTKVYTVTNLQRVVTNSPNCAPLFHDLQQLTKKPVVLQFTANSSEPAKFNAQDPSGQLKNHSYTILKQETNTAAVNRLGMGSFEINNRKVDYVVQIAADVGKQNYKYFYPVILSSENAHCYYTALVKPSKETVAAFKKNIQVGLAKTGTDLITV